MGGGGRARRKKRKRGAQICGSRTTGGQEPGLTTLERPVWLSQPRAGRPPSREGTALGRLPLPPAPRPNQQATLARLGPAHPRRPCRPRRPQRSRGRATPAPSWQQRRQGSDRWDLSLTASTVRPAVCRPAPQRHLTGARDATAPRDPGAQWLAA